MKLLIFLLALCLPFVWTETSSLRPTELSVPVDSLKDVADFFEGFFGHFGLAKPNQIIHECFCPGTAALFFKTLYGANDILVDVNARRALNLHLDFAKQFIRAFWEHGASGCAAQTQDFSDLLNALGVEKRDPLLFNIANWLYYQGHFQELLQDFLPVIGNLNGKDFSKAGDVYGVVVQHFVDSVKKEGLGYLAHAGYANGFAIGLDLKLPHDSLSVWNDTTAGVYMDFLFKWVVEVTEGGWKDVYENTVKFWNERGEKILGKIPMSVWDCLDGSNDNKAITEKLGIDILSKDYEDLMLNFFKDHPRKSYLHLKLIRDNFEQLHFIHAGIIQSNLVKEIVASR